VIVAAAVCPPAPALVPEVGVGLPEMVEIRASAAAAVQTLIAAQPERIVVIGPREVPVDVDESGGGTFAGFGVPFAAGGPNVTALPAAYTVAAWLLDQAEWTGPRLYSSSRPQLGHGEALLVMADSDTLVGVSAPTHGDPRAAKVAEVIAGALATGDAQALADLDVDEAVEWEGTGIAPLQLMGDMTKGAHIAARLRSDEAPFGVRYWVADWQLTQR